MVVKINKLLIIFFIFFSHNAFASNNVKIIRDAEIELFLQKIITSITKNLKQKKHKFYPRLIFNSQYNAFVTGSDKIYINTGLISKASSISEIQGVVAHEIGHLVLNHHDTRTINKPKNSKFSTIAAIAGIGLSMEGKLDSNTVTGLIIGSRDLATKSYLQFTRIQEQQADKFALEIMQKAKISLNGLQNLLSRLSEEELLNQSMRSSFYRSHPFSKLRLRQLKNYINLSSSLKLQKTKVFINDNLISLDYINNKIRSYNKNPFQILDKKNNTTSVLSIYNKIIGNLRIGKYDLAITNLNKLSTKFKNYPFVFELYGDIHFAKGDFNKAIENYEKAIENLNKVSHRSTDLIKFSLVKSFLQTKNLNNLNKSINILEELVKNNPRWSYLWRLLAKASGRANKKGVSYIALAEEAFIKKDFLKAKKYVILAFKFPHLSKEYILRGKDILVRTREQR
ncbi:M48 family metalloprotease [Alphaproteobacteria bacterium]|nr:M48 family metalloprotease [Alphaproteobacteria bacterium]